MSAETPDVPPADLAAERARVNVLRQRARALELELTRVQGALDDAQPACVLVWAAEIHRAFPAVQRISWYPPVSSCDCPLTEADQARVHVNGWLVTHLRDDSPLRVAADACAELAAWMPCDANVVESTVMFDIPNVNVRYELRRDDALGHRVRVWELPRL